ncbi:MAG: vanadium-dependent haloperoxidase [Saprospiraceae bacterium]|nr:vanadium-dependent haloperoxidase [Saprospiraceae bacterium]
MNGLKNNISLLKMCINIPRLIFITVFLLLVSSFNKTDNSEDSTNKKCVANIIQWYELYLRLESKDLYAYPPKSTQNIVTLAIAGKFTLDAFDENQRVKDEQFTLVVNEVYAALMTDMFKEIEGSDLYIQNHKDHIKTSYPSEDYNAINQLSKSIIHQINNHVKPYLGHLNNMDEMTKTTIKDSFLFENEDPVLPLWGMKSTLVVPKITQILLSPYHHSNSFESSIQQEALAVYSQSYNLSKEDKWIAEFWSDDVRGLTFSPAGRWISIANQLVKEENLKINDMVHLYFKLGVGLYDAAVICWMYKYSYNLQRPSDYIQTHIDPHWQPLHENPNFPSYPSGHSVLGAVASKVLEGQFGSQYRFTDKSHQNRPEFLSNNRKFDSLKDAAIENAYSRILLGVHFKEDCEAGLKLGFEVGEKINRMDYNAFIFKFHISQGAKSELCLY